jgi:signal transduction histidine kinase
MTVASWGDSDWFAEEQATLRHVATLVAKGVPSDALFGIVTQQVGVLLGVDLASVIRFESKRTVVMVAAWSADGDHADAPCRWPLPDDRVAGKIMRTNSPAREEAWHEVGGPIAQCVRDRLGIRSSVGSPIVVDDSPWGALFVHSTRNRRFPAATESRLGRFTDLLSTAIVNAQAKESLRHLAAEQSALRRVAELIAGGAPAGEVFATVAEELGRLTNVEGAKMLRFEPDNTAMFVASWGPLEAGIPAGRRLSFEGNSVTARIFETGRPARLEDYVTAEGDLAALMHREGMQSAVGAPIEVGGHLWGALLVGSVQSEPLPPDTEERIERFAELVAMSIANVEARAQVERLAEEQAALRRVAEMVARGVAAEAIFAAVAEEIGQLLDVSSSAVLRFDDDGTLLVLAAWGVPDMGEQVGRRLPIRGDNTAALVLKTRRPARMDDQSNADGEIAEIVRQLGITSTISCPVIVDGRPWGAIAVNSLQPLPLPADTEERVGEFTDLVATSIANVEARKDLAASRLRIVAATDQARRRVERDLHDGVQQRLVSLALGLRGAQTILSTDLDGASRQLSRLGEELTDALDDVRELSRGIHPAILSEGGLEPALRVLARRSTVPVELLLNVRSRLGESVEVGAYYIASEALANVAKHARASTAQLRAQLNDGTLMLEISDDGCGAADPDRGSGLIGLRDRAEALGGTFRFTTARGQGTTIHASLPV